MDYYSAYTERNENDVDEGPDDIVSFQLLSKDIVRISPKELPDAKQLVDLLRRNRVRLNCWVKLALLYYKAQRYDEFMHILSPDQHQSADLDYPAKERDQMRALDMLAAYYVQRGSQEKSPELKREWFVKATFLYTTADKIIMYDQNHLLGRAYFCLLEGNKIEQAEIQFKFVLNDDQRGGLAPATDETLMIPAMMGQACIMYMRKEYRNALQIYKKCLQLNPACPASVRVGIGYCLAKLGKPEKAKIAFQRALQLDPDDIDSQASLAVLQMTCSQDVAEMREGIQSLAQLYKVAKDHPLILNHLANHFFIKSQLNDTQDKESLLVKAKRLLDYAVTVTKNDQMLSESNFHLARYFHAQGKIHDAHRHYYLSAQQASPKFKLPTYGYGQTYILLGDYEKAIDEFEKVLKVYPDNVDVLKVLGALYSRQSQQESPDKSLGEERRRKAKECLEKAAKQSPDDLDILIDLAVLQQGYDIQNALKTYQQILDKLNGTSSFVPPEVLNNIGALNFLCKDYQKARDSFIECRESYLKTKTLDARAKAMLISVSYNLARCEERLGKLNEAERIYKGILKKRPSYMDAMFRLGCLHYIRGDSVAAVNHFKEVMAADPKNFDAWIMWGKVLFDEGQLGAAQKKFEQILKGQKSEEADPLALVSLGNIWVKTLMDVNRNREKDQSNREHALNYFHKALKRHPKNVYAMHGAGIIFAQKGDLNTAREFFGPVRERISDYRDVWINTAHVQLDSSQFQSAIQMYQTCLRRFSQRDNLDIHTNIAFAFYRMGKYEQAFDHLDKAIAKDLNNLVYMFNYALTALKAATVVLENEQSTEEQVQLAVDRLNVAEAAFKWIADMPPQKVQPYRYISRTACTELAGKSTDMIAQSERFLMRAKKNDSEQQRRMEQNERERRRVLEEQRTAARRKEEEENMRIDQLRFQRVYFMEKSKDALKRPEIEDEPRRSSGVKRKRKAREEKDFVQDSSDERDAPAESRHEKRKRAQKQARRNKKKDNDFINDGSSDDESSKKKRKKKSTREIEEEDARKFKGKIKSKAIIEDSSSSSDSEKRNGGADSDQNEVPTIRNVPGDSDSDVQNHRRTNFSSESSDDAPPAKKNIDSDDDDDASKKASEDSDDGPGPSKRPDSDEDSD